MCSSDLTRWSGSGPARSTGAASRRSPRRWGLSPSSRSCSGNPGRGLAELTGKQRRHLRALGHHLSPVLHIGHEGLTEAVVAQANAQLDAYELIKVKVSESSPLTRHEAAEQLASTTSSELAQVLGRTFLLYKPHPTNPQISLPD